MKSDKLETLAINLIEDLKKRNDPFKESIILFTSHSVASFFKAFYLKHNDGILMNVKYMTIDNAIYDLFMIDPSLRKASKKEISSLIIKCILEKKLYSNYLDDELKGIKLFDLASELATLFSSYEQDLAFDASFSDVDNKDKQDIEKEIYDYVSRKLQDAGFITLNYVLNDGVKVGCDKDIYLFGFNEYSRWEKAVIDKINKEIDIKEYKLEYCKLEKIDKNNIVKAPKKVREVENLHSTICNILLSDSDATFSDFLVISNNLSEYENDINRVFNQDNVNFPSIPYFINSQSEKDNDALSLFNSLLSILSKGFLVKSDFLDIISNNIIRNTKDISIEDAALFKDILEDLGVFRFETWNNAIKRMLLSKISDINDSDNKVNLENKDYLPYYKIGLDDEKIVKFIEVYNDIKRLINFKNESETINETNLNELMQIIAKFYSKVEFGQETSKTLSKLQKLAEFWREARVFGVPLITILLIFKDQLRRINYSVGEEYFSGISFKSFNRGETLASKFLFILGASSNNFDSKTRVSSLDFRKEKNDFELDKNTLNLIVHNCKNTYVSYVYRDLKSDGEYYLSELVMSLVNSRVKEEEIRAISLDEERDYASLFTKDEFRHKNYYLNLFESSKNEEKEPSYIEETEQNFVYNLSVAKIASFLDEPLSLKASLLFDNEDDTKLEDYESLNISALDRANLFKILIKDYFSYLNNKNRDLEAFKEAEFERLDLEGVLNGSSKIIKEAMFNVCFINLCDFLTKLDSLDNYEVVSEFDLRVDDYNIDSFDIYIKSEESDHISYFLTKVGKSKVKEKDYLNLYVLSLLDVIRNKISKKIILNPYFDEKKTKEYEINYLEARVVLLNIIGKINDFSNLKAFDNSIDSEDIESVAFIYEAIKDNKWEYFKHKELFNEDNIGYSDLDIKSIYKNEQKEYIKLVKYYKEAKDGE